MFTRDQLQSAHEQLVDLVPPTPQYAWPLLGDAAGCEVWVKHENHTPTGAFKVRGGVVYLNDWVTAGHSHHGLITATRGNHGQSLPFAARRHGVPVRVYVPQGNSREKNAAMRAWGAELVEFGQDFDEAREEAARQAEALELYLVPSFDERLIRGVATYAWELFHSVPDLHTVYVPIGMGSGICGLIGCRDLLGLQTDIVGVVSERADAMASSVEAGTLTETDSAQTFADGIATRVPHPAAFDIIQHGAARIVRVSDQEIAEAMRLLYYTTHNIAEGAGAAACAALFKERDAMAGRKVGVILTGGNIDRDVFASVLDGRTPPC